MRLSQGQILFNMNILEGETQNIQKSWMMGYKLKQFMWSLEDWDRIQNSFELKEIDRKPMRRN